MDAVLSEIQNQYDYDIWGNPTLTVEAYDCGIRFAGEYFDSESGLYYLRARYYDPHLGRFLSQDTFKGKENEPLSLNLYTYCANNPISYVDPSGHTYFQIGDRGDGVVQIQEKLIALGYDLGSYGADGIFGQKTYDAIVSFQSCYDLDADGIVGNQTFTALLSLTEHKDDDPETLAAFQDNAKNVSTGDIDGKYSIGSEKTHEEIAQNVKDMREAGGEENTTIHTNVENNQYVSNGYSMVNPSTGQAEEKKFETSVDLKNTDAVGEAKAEIAVTKASMPEAPQVKKEGSGTNNQSPYKYIYSKSIKQGQSWQEKKVTEVLPIIDLINGVSGKNIITGKDLSDSERSEKIDAYFYGLTNRLIGLGAGGGVKSEGACI